MLWSRFGSRILRSGKYLALRQQFVGEFDAEQIIQIKILLTNSFLNTRFKLSYSNNTAKRLSYHLKRKNFVVEATCKLLNLPRFPLDLGYLRPKESLIQIISTCVCPFAPSVLDTRRKSSARTSQECALVQKLFRLSEPCGQRWRFYA